MKLLLKAAKMAAIVPMNRAVSLAHTKRDGLVALLLLPSIAMKIEPRQVIKCALQRLWLNKLTFSKGDNIKKKIKTSPYLGRIDFAASLFARLMIAQHIRLNFFS